MPKTKKPTPKKKAVKTSPSSSSKKTTSTVKSTPAKTTPKKNAKTTTKTSKTTSKTVTTRSASQVTVAKPIPAQKKTHHPFATFLIFVGVIIIIIAIIYYLVPSPGQDAFPASSTYDAQNATPSSELTDEQLAAMVPTVFNQATGTTEESLGSTALPEVSPTPNPSPLAVLAETGLEELNTLQDTAITSTQEQMVQVGEQVNYTTSSVIDRIGQIISGFITWGRNWLFGTVDEWNLPSPEPIPTPTPEPIPTATASATLNLVQVNAVQVQAANPQ